MAEATKQASRKASGGLRFSAELVSNGRTATGIEVPEAVVAALGSHKRPPVRVTLREHTYRTTVGVMGGRSLIPVSAEHRALAGVQAGDQVDVSIALDDEPRDVVVPTDFEDALTRDPAARRSFDALSYSQRRWLVESVEGAKKPETRAARIEKHVQTLREGRAR